MFFNVISGDIIMSIILHLNRLNNGNITVTSLSDKPSRRSVPHPVATFKQAFECYGRNHYHLICISIAISLMQRNVGEILQICMSKFNKPTPIQVLFKNALLCASCLCL